MKIEAVDLFCGAGGLTAGLLKAGVHVKAGIDVDIACQYPYEHNNHATFIPASVTELSGKDLAQHYSSGAIRVLAGCAPCQPFSKYTQGLDKSKDKKWPLLYQFGRLTEELQPDYVTMENVPEVTRHSVYQDFLRHLHAMGYETQSSIVPCEEYGVPQARKRCVVLASKHGSISLIKPTHKNAKKSVRKAIGSLPRIAAGEHCTEDPLHSAASLSEMNLLRIQASNPGGSWREWPDRLKAECHKKESGKNYGSVYGRMSWDMPSPTITTLCYGFGNGRFGHPEQDRAISLREAALLQSFPKSYMFAPKEQRIDFRTIGRLIGNAVPVRLGEIIGRSILNHAALNCAT